jgi:hypothetical protein
VRAMPTARGSSAGGRERGAGGGDKWSRDEEEEDHGKDDRARPRPTLLLSRTSASKQTLREAP